MLTQNIGTAIPTIVDGGNHTLGFTKAAATMEAHYACLDVSKALASTGVRVLIDDVFFEKVHTNDLFNTVAKADSLPFLFKVKQTFQEDEKARGTL